MRRWNTALALLAAFGLSPCGALAARSSCETCHSQEAAEYAASAHVSAQMTCVSCHGGDPTDMQETAMSKDKGFKGSPSRTAQPAFCAGCHAKGSVMRGYGLPTDQYEEYQQSHHGRAVATGNTSAAVCTDCHTVHAIRKADDPRATVAPENVPATCSRCHDDDKLMAASGVRQGIGRQYRESVHGRALLDGHNDSAPNCASCHGSHAATPPQVKEVGLICATCHPNTMEQFRQSPHAAAVDSGKMTPCVSCHTDHTIQHPTPDLILTSCAPCHQNDAEVKALAQRLHDELVQAAELYDATAQEVQEDGGATLPLEKIEPELDEAHTALLRTAVQQHSLQPRDVEKMAVVIRAVAEDLDTIKKDRTDRHRFRIVILAYIWGYLLTTILVIFKKRQRFERQRMQAQSHGGR